MPIVTALEPAPGWIGGCLVQVDGEAPFRVSEDLARRENLELGMSIEGPQLAALMYEAGCAEAMDRAVHYLSYRPRTGREVRRYLGKHRLAKYADHAIGRLIELGYLDDRGYAEAFVRERIRLKPRGAPRLVSELLARGIERQTADRAVETVLAEEGVSEQSLLRTAATRRAGALGALEPATARRRLSAYLARRGFRAGDIRQVALELLPDETDGCET